MRMVGKGLKRLLFSEQYNTELITLKKVTVLLKALYAGEGIASHASVGAISPA